MRRRHKTRGLGSLPAVHLSAAKAQLDSAAYSLNLAREAGSCPERALHAYHAATHAALAEEQARDAGDTRSLSQSPFKTQAAEVAVEAIKLFGGCVSQGAAPRVPSRAEVARSRFTLVRGGGR